MRIKSVTITNLFGVFNHVIPMKLDEHITIIHGPNGFGKTVLLGMLDGIFNSRFSQFRIIPFGEFRIEFDDRSKLSVTRSGRSEERQSRKQNGAPKITFDFSRRGGEAQSFQLEDPREIEFPLSIIEHEIPELDRVGEAAWRHLPTNEILSLDDVVERYGQLLPFRREPVPSKNREWLQQLQEAIHVRFIQTQRLLTSSVMPPRLKYERQGSLVPAVNRYSEDLAKGIQSNLAAYAAVSQSLDRSFPQRLVVQKPSSVLTADDLDKKLADLEARRSRFMQIGLLDRDEKEAFQIPPGQIDAARQGVLSVYVRDVEEKLSVLDDVAARISLFSRIINERFLYKKMTISKDKGFIFETTKGDPLTPSSLSSGEQHEIVLLYELLFKIGSNSLVMIDEPELSLHAAWQEQFLKDLKGITEVSNFDVLISTHSPQIISDRWDLTVELKNPAP